MLEAILTGIGVGYALGSVPVGLWVGRRVQGVDLRAGGSGKIGATNALRHLGARWSALIFVLDVGKGVAPVALVRLAFDSATGEALAALAAVLGHIFPLFASFRGGRAAATGFGALLMLTPTAAALGLGVALILLVGTRIMSLSVLLGLTVACTAQGLLVAFGGEPAAYCGFAAGAWAIITLAHWDNILRLAAGRERVLAWPPHTTAGQSASSATDGIGAGD